MGTAAARRQTLDRLEETAVGTLGGPAKRRPGFVRALLRPEPGAVSDLGYRVPGDRPLTTPVQLQLRAEPAT